MWKIGLTYSCGRCRLEAEGGGGVECKSCRIKSAATDSDRDLTAAAGSHQPSAELQFCRVCTPPVASSQLFTHRSQKFKMGLCVCVRVRKLERACVCTFAKWWYKSSSKCVCVWVNTRELNTDWELVCVCLRYYFMQSLLRACVYVTARDWERNQELVCICAVLLHFSVHVCVSCRPGFTLTES